MYGMYQLAANQRLGEPSRRLSEITIISCILIFNVFAANYVVKLT